MAESAPVDPNQKRAVLFADRFSHNVVPNRLHSLQQSLPAPAAELNTCVIVPCKNEAVHLPEALSALWGQIDRNGRPLPKEQWEVLLLVNNSTDHSLAAAHHFQQRHPGLTLHVVEHQFPAAQANIGHVRKLLMDTASERLLQKRKDCSLILSTDADTQVAPDWIAQNRAEAHRGAEAIGGRIKLSTSDGRSLNSQAKRIQLWDERYNLLVSWLEDRCDPQAHDPWPRHHQHFAASFAVTPQAYRTVGGLPPKESLEDMAFYDALLRHDIRFRHSPDVCVYTSARVQGRTAIGLAEQLNRWSNGPSNIVVPSVPLLQTFFSLRAQARSLWQIVRSDGRCSGFALQTLSAQCGVPPEELREALYSPWFGTAFESLAVRSNLEKGIFAGRTLQPLEEAVSQLQRQFDGVTRQPHRSIEEVQSDSVAL